MSFCVTVLVLGFLWSGCGHVESPPLPLHALTEGIRASSGLPNVVVNRFKDLRPGAQSNQVGTLYRESRGSESGFAGKALLLPSPDLVGTAVAGAFARGLAARGFSVIDQTDIEFVPGVQGAASLRVGVQTILAGDVLQFWETTACAGAQGAFPCYQWQTGATVTILLRIHEPTSGRTVWEKEYATQGRWMTVRPGGGGYPYAPPTHHLANLLMKVVREAVSSWDLVEHLGGLE